MCPGRNAPMMQVLQPPEAVLVKISAGDALGRDPAMMSFLVDFSRLATGH